MGFFFAVFFPVAEVVEVVYSSSSRPSWRRKAPCCVRFSPLAPVRGGSTPAGPKTFSIDGREGPESIATIALMVGRVVEKLFPKI